jgi:hypothetical protein
MGVSVQDRPLAKACGPALTAHQMPQEPQAQKADLVSEILLVRDFRRPYPLVIADIMRGSGRYNHRGEATAATQIRLIPISSEKGSSFGDSLSAFSTESTRSGLPGLAGSGTRAAAVGVNARGHL